MIGPGERSRGVGRDAGAVVRPLTLAARRPCARPGCPSPAGATLVFSYATREAWLDRLGEPDPQAYDLCAPHAARTRPPHGWQLRDRRPAEERRPEEEDAVGAPFGGEQTVAVLAAALRAVPDLPAAEGEADAVTEDPSPVLGRGAARPGDVGTAATDIAPQATAEGQADAAASRPRSSAHVRPRPKPILAARARRSSPPPSGSRAADW